MRHKRIADLARALVMAEAGYSEAVVANEFNSKTECIDKLTSLWDRVCESRKALAEAVKLEGELMDNQKARST